MDPLALALGLIIGIPASLLAYWWTRRNAKRGYGQSFGNDYGSLGGHGGNAAGDPGSNDGTSS